MNVAPPGGVLDVLVDRPDLVDLYREMVVRIWTSSGVDPVLLELCRLRVAQMHGCEDALTERTQQAIDAGLDEDVVARLPDWPTDPAFAGAPRAALAYTEKFVMDVHAITDDETAAVVAELGDDGTVGLVLALGMFDGSTRLRLILNATKEN